MSIFKGKPQSGSVYHARLSESVLMHLGGPLLEHTCKLFFDWRCSTPQDPPLSWPGGLCSSMSTYLYTGYPFTSIGYCQRYPLCKYVYMLVQRVPLNKKRYLPKCTLCEIHGHPRQYIQVDTIFNNMCHFGLPGTCL